MDKPEYIWSRPEWPHFYHNTKAFESLEQAFIKEHLTIKDLLNECSPETILETQSNLGIIETVYTSRIEGINLNTNSIFESYLNNIPQKREEKHALALLKLAIDHIGKPLTHSFIKEMNRTLLPELPHAGTYVGDMKIIEGNQLMDKHRIIYEGVPKSQVEEEMDTFINWFNSCKPSTPLVNAIRGHIHFESIHPFPDGNGRVGRAIMLIGLCRDLQTNIPLAISRAIEDSRSDYYKMFDNRTHHQSLDISSALNTLQPTFISSIQHTKKIISLSKLRQNLKQATLNPRQEKAMNRLIN
jgi:Fic family protein